MSNSSLFIERLCDDFIREFYYFSGILCGRERSLCRMRLLGNAMVNYQANILRSTKWGKDESQAYQETVFSDLENYIGHAARRAAKAYESNLKKMTIDEIENFAICGTDRIFEYMTNPLVTDITRYPKWSGNRFFIGLVEGNPQRWPTRVSNRLNEKKESFDLIYKSYRKEVWDELSVMTGNTEESISFNDSLINVSITMEGADDFEEEKELNKFRSNESLLEKLIEFERDLQRFVFPEENLNLVLEYYGINEDASVLYGIREDEFREFEACCHRMRLRHAAAVNDASLFRFQNFHGFFFPSDSHRLSFEDASRASSELNRAIVGMLNPGDGFLSWFSEIFFKYRSGRYLLLGDPESLKAFLLPHIFSFLNNPSLENSAPVWLPILIDATDYNFSSFNDSENFIAQYIKKILGYASQSLAVLKKHYNFIFIFNAIDRFPERFKERICSGVEITPWRNAKVIFTARQDWVIPKNMEQDKQVKIPHFTLADLQDIAVVGWQNPKTNIFLDTYADHLTKYPYLLPLIRPFSISLKEARKRENNLPSISLKDIDFLPVLFSIVLDLKTFINEEDYRDFGPQNRFELYQHWFQQSTISTDVFLELQGIILSNIAKTSTYHSLSVQSARNLLGVRFLSIQIDGNQEKAEYAVNEYGWIDFIVAEHVIKNLGKNHSINSVESRPWNHINWVKDYPMVVDFVVEYIENIKDVEEQRWIVNYLHRRYIANGCLVGREYGFYNAEALLRRLTIKSDPQFDLSDIFICLPSSREMNVVHELSDQELDIKRSVFKDLGHGTGISAANPNIPQFYQTPHYYIPANSLDKDIATKLVNYAYECIEKGDLDEIRHLCPDHWGLYQREAAWEIDKQTYELALSQALIEYIDIVMQKFKPDNEAILLGEAAAQGKTIFDRFIKREFRKFHLASTHEEWLKTKRDTYQKEIKSFPYFFTRSGKYVPIAESEDKIDSRLRQYKKTITLRISELSEVVLNATNKALDQLHPDELMFTDDSKILPTLRILYILRDILMQQKREFELKREQIKNKVDRYQMLSKLLIRNTYERFRILMSLDSETKKKYDESYKLSWEFKCVRNDVTWGGYNPEIPAKNEESFGDINQNVNAEAEMACHNTEPNLIYYRVEKINDSCQGNDHGPVRYVLRYRTTLMSTDTALISDDQAIAAGAPRDFSFASFFCSEDAKNPEKKLEAIRPWLIPLLAYQQHLFMVQPDLQREIFEGNLGALMKRFYDTYVNTKCKPFFDKVKKAIENARSQAFTAWIEGKVPSGYEHHALEWQQLQTAWKQEDDGNKNLLLASIRVGTIKAVVAMYQACEFQENLLIFRDIVMESIQMSINANPPSTIIQNAAASFSISCDELMSERIIQCLKEPNRPKEAFNEFKKLLLSANVFLYPTQEFWDRYFCFGLIVDACAAEKHETLLHRALPELSLTFGMRGEVGEKLKKLYDIVQYFINAGANIFAECPDSDQSPARFVEKQYRLGGTNEYLSKTFEVFVMINAFYSQEIKFDYALSKIVKELIDFVHQYEQILKGETDSVLSNSSAYFSGFFRSEHILNSRRSAVSSLPSEIENIRRDLFNLPEVLDKLEKMVKNQPTNIMQGRLTTGILMRLTKLFTELKMNRKNYQLVNVSSRYLLNQDTESLSPLLSQYALSKNAAVLKKYKPYFDQKIDKNDDFSPQHHKVPQLRGLPSQGYIRHEVEGNGNCGYTAFGVTREDAVELLMTNINDICHLIKIPLKSTLLLKNFYQHLLDSKLVDAQYVDMVNSEQILTAYSTDVKIQKAYVQYDVQDRQIEDGFCHPAVLQALAHICNIELHIWRLGWNDVLIPHAVHTEDYAVYRANSAESRLDILFVNGNHFERLDIQGYGDNIPTRGIYPLCRQTDQESFDSKTETKTLSPSRAVAAKGSLPDYVNAKFR